MSKQITIDGFNGTGKTTLARSLAKRLNYTYISTGIIFRSLSYCLLENEIGINDIENICKIFENMRLELPDNNSKSIIINDTDITDEIMDMKYAVFASKISDNELIQSLVRDYIRKYAMQKNIIIDGRDTGRILFPNADLKLALVADIETRAKRRMNQSNKLGKTLEEIIHQINQIDETLIQTNCIPPIDAITIDTTKMEAQEVLDKALAICKQKGIVTKSIDDELTK